MRLRGTWVFRTQGDGEALKTYEDLLAKNEPIGLPEIRVTGNTLKRIDVTSRSLVGFVEHGSCFHGVLSGALGCGSHLYDGGRI